MKNSLILLLSFLLVPWAMAQSLNANEIIEKAEKKLRGESSHTKITVKIIRPKWSREMTLEGWSLGNDYSLSIVRSPAKEAGTVFLKRKNEVYNYVPTIERTIKLPPSMMMQNWMGTDLTNDDLVRETSMVEDYDATLVGEETIDGRDCYKLELIPKPDAAVVWGRVVIWIDKQEFLQLKIEFYDEDDYLINTFLGKDIKELGGRMLTSTFEVIPAEKEGHKTVMMYDAIEFNVDLEPSFFTTQNMRKIR